MEFQVASIVQWFMAFTDVCDVLGSIPGSAISFYNVGFIFFGSKFFSRVFLQDFFCVVTYFSFFKLFTKKFLSQYIMTDILSPPD